MAAPVGVVEIECDGVVERTSLAAFARDNEGSAEVVERVLSLRPGESATFGGGAAPLIVVRRRALPKPARSSVVRIRVPWSFDRSSVVVVEIDRSSGIVVVRPYRRRARYHANLGDLAALVADRATKAAILAKRKARKAGRRKP